MFGLVYGLKGYKVARVNNMELAVMHLRCSSGDRDMRDNSSLCVGLKSNQKLR